MGQTPGVTLPKQINLAATDWCPYACEHPADQKPGIVHEYLTQLFAAQGITLNIQFFPWSRAIEEANKGRVDGLLTAVYAEAPDLILPTRLPWHMACASSPRNIQVGSIKGSAAYSRLTWP